MKQYTMHLAREAVQAGQVTTGGGGGHLRVGEGGS